MGENVSAFESFYNDMTTPVDVWWVNPAMYRLCQQRLEPEQRSREHRFGAGCAHRVCIDQLHLALETKNKIMCMPITTPASGVHGVINVRTVALNPLAMGIPDPRLGEE